MIYCFIINFLVRRCAMAFLEENEWILLNEVAYNISFIYTVEEMQKAILNRWLPFLISYDAAVFSRLSVTEDGDFKFLDTEGYNLSLQSIQMWEDQTRKDDAFRWMIYSTNRCTFAEDISQPGSRLQDSEIYRTFWEPNRLSCSAGLCIAFREEPMGFLRLYRKEGGTPFTPRDLFVLEQLRMHFAYRLAYEAKKGDSRYFFAKGYQEKLCRQYGLTAREGEMLDLAVQGWSNDDISKQLSISIHTVKKHFQSIYAKMHVRNRVQMLQCLPTSTSKVNFDELQ